LEAICHTYHGLMIEGPVVSGWALAWYGNYA